MTEEIWKPMKFNSEYEISNLGRVKHLAHDTPYTRNGIEYVRHYDEYILSTRMDECYRYGCPTGEFYKIARISGGSILVADEVLKAFTNKKIYYSNKIIYKDGNPENCSLENLDYDEKNNIYPQVA